MPHVISQRNVGKYQTYDLEVDHIDHQFYLSNGLLTSNSHAVSYALDSYMCAWLLTHHEAEWLCAYAEEYASGNDKKRARALTEIRALGYTISRVDINHADKTWTILPNKHFMPSFTTIKSIGEAAVDEIIQKRPYADIYDLLWNADGSWKHAKCNKRVLENLIKIGAFESLDIIGPGKHFSSYRHMHHVIIENWTQIKKRNGRQLFDTITKSTYNTIVDWTRDEKVAMYVQLVGALDVDIIVPANVMLQLNSKNITSIDDAEDGETNIHWFVITEIKICKTQKGKHYARLSVVGAGGAQQSMNIWGFKPDDNNIEKYAAYIGELEKSDWGLSSTQWKLRKIS